MNSRSSVGSGITVPIRSLTTVLAAVAMLVVGPAGTALASHTSSAPDEGWAFEVAPLSEDDKIYDIQDPTENRALQRHIIKRDNEPYLWVETWLPQDRTTGKPVLGIPTVLTLSPYAKAGSTPNTHFDLKNLIVPRGYAYSVMHLRGTGASGGCIDQLGDNDAADGLAAIRYVAEAEWSNGLVALSGLSAPAGAALRTVGQYPEVAANVKAMVLGGPWVPSYAVDGVRPYVGQDWAFALVAYGFFPYCCAPTDFTIYGESPEDFMATRFEEGGNPEPEHIAERPGCLYEHAAAGEGDGSVTPFWAEREVRQWTRDITVPTFLFQGFADTITSPRGIAGLFDHIDAPKAGLFGWWWHETPDAHYSGVEPAWERTDFMPMVMAWLDHHVKGVDNGADRWPIAQVQDNEGQWRAEADWPTTGGPVGHLALGDGGLLGDDDPSGTSTYTEELLPFDRDFDLDDPNTSAVFQTAPLTQPLHITGQPLLDLWVTIDRPDGHIAVELEALDADGSPVFGPTASGDGVVFGARSLQHLDPLEDGVFLQSVPKEPRTGEPIRVPVRMSPIDIVVPEGGWLRLRVAGSARYGPGLEPAAGLPTIFQHPTRTSGSGTVVTILHDCEHTSALRFLMPREQRDLLNVREEEKGPLTQTSSASVPVDGGIATEPVCGEGPQRVLDVIPTLGQEIDYRWSPQVERRSTSVDLELSGRGLNRMLQARLSDAVDGHGIEGRIIDFYADGDHIGSAATDGTGRATVNVPPSYRGGRHTFAAAFEGDAFFMGSSTTART